MNPFKKPAKTTKKPTIEFTFRSRWQMQTCVPQIAVLKDPPNVFSWEIDIFSDCYFQEHFEATTSAFYPMAQNMPKGDIKTIKSPALRHSFIHCPQTSLCQLWTDIFNRVLEYVS